MRSLTPLESEALPAFSAQLPSLPAEEEEGDVAVCTGLVA